MNQSVQCSTIFFQDEPQIQPYNKRQASKTKKHEALASDQDGRRGIANQGMSSWADRSLTLRAFGMVKRSNQANQRTMFRKEQIKKGQHSYAGLFGLTTAKES
jgi:hypothetical protein